MTATNMAEVIRRFRAELELTQAELGAAMGVHQQAVYKIEAGRRVLSANELARIAVYYGVPMEVIVFGEDVEFQNIEAAALRIKLAEIAEIAALAATA